jgi:hypothetical protein
MDILMDTVIRGYIEILLNSQEFLRAIAEGRD